MDAPPVLTPQRIDAMLSIMAEVCLEGVVEAGRFQKAAEDAEAFERSGRTLQRACRNLRQTIAMKQRHDREQALLAEGARKIVQVERAEAERVEAQRAQAEQAWFHRMDRRKEALHDHFHRLLWTELERPDAQELFDELARRVEDAGNEDAFLQVPLEDLVVRFADEIGILAAPNNPPTPAPAAKPRSTAEVAEVAETPHLRVLSEPSVSSAVENGACGAHGTQPASPAPPPHPPDPEPYIPPWERLRPGQRMPGGGTGW